MAGQPEAEEGTLVRRLLVAMVATLILVLATVTQVSGNTTIDAGTNALRKANGVAPLQVNSLLTGYAAARAKAISVNFAHDFDRLNAYVTATFPCWRLDGENIAYHTLPVDTQWVVGAWTNSPHHRYNMLNPAFNLTGSARYDANGRAYFVQVFVSTCSQAVATPKPTSKPKPKATARPTAQTFTLPDTSVR